ncbi:hypothetical protein J7M23_07660 [Candidatus Sumerlaeota bacterium]|nr:hypothetical protein [Candidatus Sumerlaeota bacterium]
MGKKKRVKEVKETKKTIIILAIVGGFLIALLLSQTIFSFKRLDLQRCIINMVAIEEAMKKMDEEYGFKFDPKTQSDTYILNTIVLYFKYGKKALYRDEHGYIHHKPIQQLEGLEEVSRADNFFPEYPKCPDGGTYSFIPVENSNLFNIKCSKHGIIEQPNAEGRYVFDGEFSRLSTYQTNLGWESRILVPRPYKIGKDIIYLVPKPKSTPEPTEDEKTSPTLSGNTGGE